MEAIKLVSFLIRAELSQGHRLSLMCIIREGWNSSVPSRVLLRLRLRVVKYYRLDKATSSTE